MAEGEDKLKEQIRALPDQPGVYQYFDSENTIIYVGKAKSLKKRVSSYFNKQTGHSYKTQKLVSQIHKIEYVVVSSERDALLLENNLIKNHQPKYNILLKDDKSYPFIVITNESFPKVFTVRNKKIKGEYFGPYTSARHMRSLLDLIRTTYTIRTCNLLLTRGNIQSQKFKVCLEYHIGNCKGPCEGLQREEDYLSDINQVRYILRGRVSIVKQAILQEMNRLAEGFEFERAQKLKEKLLHIEYFQEKSQVITPNLGDMEVYTADEYENYIYINYLQVIEGSITSTDTTRIKRVLEESKEEILNLYITDKRFEQNSEIKEIITNCDIENDWEVKIIQPERGERKQLIELSLKNIKQLQIDKKLRQTETKNKEIPSLVELQQALGLKKLPERIECFDNSNIQGTNPVAGMVCFINGKPAKKEYRTYNIKTVVGPDDFASMYEVVQRRYTRQIAENQPLPDLIIIDGGKGQLNAACDALKDINLYGQIPIISIAKRLEELYVPEDEFPLHLSKKSMGLQLILQIRDAVHQLAISSHRNQRSKNAYTLTLEEVKGLGPKTMEVLYKHFGGLKKIKAATTEEFEPLIGKAKAEILSKALKELK